MRSRCRRRRRRRPRTGVSIPYCAAQCKMHITARGRRVQNERSTADRKATVGAGQDPERMAAGPGAAGLPGSRDGPEAGGLRGAPGSGAGGLRGPR